MPHCSAPPHSVPAAKTPASNLGRRWRRGWVTQLSPDRSSNFDMTKLTLLWRRPAWSLAAEAPRRGVLRLFSI
jgi:hypothetical protein